MVDLNVFHREITKMILNLYINSRVTKDIQKLMKNHHHSAPFPCQNNNDLNVAVRKRKFKRNYISITSHYFKLKDMEALFILSYMTQLRPL